MDTNKNVSECFVTGCIDGSSLSPSVATYSSKIASTLNLPIRLLNTIEHDHNPRETNLSGNIGLGESDELLEKLANDEQQKSKEDIQKGREALKAAKSSIKNQELTIETMQRHGSLYENLVELEQTLRVLILGVKGKEHEDSKNIGAQVEDIIRGLNVPTLLVKGEYRDIKKVMIAYDGSSASQKALELVAKTPIFGEVERHLVSVNKDDSLLQKAKDFLKESNIEAEVQNLKGDALQELLNYQKSHDIDIIAMGAFSHGRLKSALFGSFTHKMLLSVDTPLLLLR